MLSAILTKVTGRSALDLAQEWIFFAHWHRGRAVGTPARRGISPGRRGAERAARGYGALWTFDRQRRRVGRGADHPSGLYPRGARQSRSTTTPAIPIPTGARAMGYQMWRCRVGAFRADGMGGQYIVMDLERKLVVVFTSALGSDIGVPLQYLENLLLPGVHAQSLPENVRAYASLTRLARELAHPAPAAAPENVPWGEYALEENPLGIARFGWTEKEILLQRHGAVLRVPYEWGAPVVTRLPEETARAWEMRAPELAVTGLPGATPRVRLHVVGGPFTMYISLEANGAGNGGGSAPHRIWKRSRAGAQGIMDIWNLALNLGRQRHFPLAPQAVEAIGRARWAIPMRCSRALQPCTCSSCPIRRLPGARTSQA